MLPNKKRSSTYNSQDFKSVIDEIVQIGLSLGINFLGYTQVSLSLFGKLPSLTQKNIIAGLGDYIDTVGDLDPELPKAHNEAAILRRAAQKLGILIPEDFYSQIIGDEIIEIYHLEQGIQVYRNLEFMKYSSYDLATIVVSSWEQLFERPPEIHALMARRAAEAVQKAHATEPWQLPKHVLIERLHPERNKFEMDMINVAPGIEIRSGNRVYWVSSLKVKPLGSSLQDYSNVKPLLRNIRA